MEMGGRGRMDEQMRIVIHLEIGPLAPGYADWARWRHFETLVRRIGNLKQIVLRIRKNGGTPGHYTHFRLGRYGARRGLRI